MANLAFHPRKLQCGTCLVVLFVVSACLMTFSTVGKGLVKDYSMGNVLKKLHTATYLDSNQQQDVSVLPGAIENVWIFNASNESPETRETVARHQCVQLKTTGRETKICVHPQERDMWVSKNLIKSGTWENGLVNLVERSLAQHPGMTLLDLGCNIGAFTVYFAAMGRRVVSVDANKENLLLLTRSLNMDHLYDNVTLIWNAMSDVRENVVLIEWDATNQASMYVQPKNKTDTTETVRSTMRDDLIPLFGKDESIFIKMDIESYEWKALNGGWNFFKQMKVEYVVMEFKFHKSHERGKQICDFMTRFGFRPYDAGGSNRPLKTSGYANWPVDVFWKKK